MFISPSLMLPVTPFDHRLLAGRVSPTIRMKLAGSRAFPNKLHIPQEENLWKF